MEDFHELIDTLKQTKQETGIGFVIAPCSSIAGGSVEFSLMAKAGGTKVVYDMTNCREAIGFLEGFEAYYHVFGDGK